MAVYTCVCVKRRIVSTTQVQAASVPPPATPPNVHPGELSLGVLLLVYAVSKVAGSWEPGTPGRRDTMHEGLPHFLGHLGS
jgi:hypothetical protein